MATPRVPVVDETVAAAEAGRLTWRECLFARFLRNLRVGVLDVTFPGGARRSFGTDSAAERGARMHIRDSAFFGKVFADGAVGFGEAYVDGLWETPDLAAVLTVLSANQREMGRIGRGFSVLAHWANRLYLRARRNTPERSRNNIREHYDLSNAFFAAFLDPGMTYSSALFADDAEALETAQKRKIDRLLDEARVGPGARILEVGTGWGSLALRAAERGYAVTTLTLSEEQQAYARERIERAGYGDRIEIRFQDYRSIQGRFDAVVSCEMIEAVGKEYLPEYFEVVQRSLKSGARAVLQAITIPDERYAAYCRSCDWIQKHIFPGGHLPSPGALRNAAAGAGLEIRETRSFGKDYARTLRRWADSFHASLDDIRALGFDERFVRKWDYYFRYCEAGFENGLIDVNHLVVEPRSASFCG